MESLVYSDYILQIRGMLQRIQHLYLLIITGICIMYLKWPIISGEVLRETPVTINISSTDITAVADGATRVIEENAWPMYILIGIAAVSFISIFLFNNRNLQNLLCYFNYLLIVAFDIVLIQVWFSNMSAEEFPIDSLTTLSWIRVVLAIGLLFINFLAIQGIKKDEDLIRSIDRIR